MVKVSVVVATYNSGERLDNLVESLDRQSLPRSEFEVIFVDDGSTDETPERLRRIAAGREHVKVAGIPNSGWPGRPRNVGTDMATGEYVIYVDHDDELFPEALERMYEYALVNRSDVVIGKEVRSGAPTSGLGVFSRNRPRMPLGGTLFAVLTPHKLYRRRFLVEQDIRFPEGRRRLEDHLFNAEVYLNGARVSVLANYPCYRWITYDDNSNNSRKMIDQEMYWRNVAEILEVVREHTEPGATRDAIMQKWYRGRVAKFARQYANWPAHYRRTAFGPISNAATTLFPEHLDRQLSAAQRAHTRLVRAGNPQGLRRVAELDAGIRLDTQLEDIDWRDGVLHVRATATMVNSDGAPYLLRRDGERLMRVVPAALERLIRPEDRDVTAEVPKIAVTASLRDRESGTDWLVPCVGTLELVDVPGGLAVRSTHEIAIDPSTVVFGGPLADGVWNIKLRTNGMGYDLRQRLAVEKMAALPALIDGRAMVAYSTAGDSLALDLGHHVRTVIGSAHPTPEDVVAVADGEGVAVTMALPRVHVRGEARHVGEVVVGEESYPATLTANGRDAAVKGRLIMPARWRPVMFRFLGRQSAVAFTIAPGPDGPAVRPAPARAESADRLVRRLIRGGRRRLGRVRRRLAAVWRGRKPTKVG